MKNTLKLEFQLDAINYGRKNFVHADLDWETFSAMQAERGESMLTLMLNSMMYQMGRLEGGQGPRPVGLPELLVALSSPNKERELRLLLARQFEDIDQQIAGMQGPDGSVLLTERNKAALKALRVTLTKGKKNIGIFYGGAHLKDMEKDLQRMGFVRTGVTYRTAWDMPAPPTTRPKNSATTRASH